MATYEYMSRLPGAVNDALDVAACKDCTEKRLGGHTNIGGKAHMNAALCFSCATSIAAPIEALVRDLEYTLVGQWAEEAAFAWRRLRALNTDDADFRWNFDDHLSFDPATCKDPQAWREMWKALNSLSRAVPKVWFNDAAVKTSDRQDH